MATKHERNAVYDALDADIKSLVSDLVPYMFRSTVTSQITTARILKLVDDAIAAYEKSKNEENAGTKPTA